MQGRCRKMFFLLAAVCVLTACADGSETVLMLESVCTDETTVSGEIPGTEPVAKADAEIYVHICGCVRSPGVYVLEDGARIFQAVEAAGGMTGDADTSAVNLAMVLEDQMRIYIPSYEETAEDTVAVVTGRDASAMAGKASVQTNDVSAEAGDAVSARININTATAEQLTQLSGIGPSRAEDIIEYRTTHGRFNSIEELMNVSGIKAGVFEKIKNQITVN